MFAGVLITGSTCTPYRESLSFM